MIFVFAVGAFYSKALQKPVVPVVWLEQLENLVVFG